MSEFRITGPGFYKQRNGGRGEVVGRTSRGVWLGLADQLGPTTWDVHGRCWGSNVLDLIAPWAEPRRMKVWLLDSGSIIVPGKGIRPSKYCSGSLPIGSAWITEGEWAEPGDKPE